MVKLNTNPVQPPTMPIPVMLLAQLATWPARVGPPPPMTPTNPQEQLGQWPPSWGLVESLMAYGLALPGVVEQPSRVAPDGARALTLPQVAQPPAAAFMEGREFAHVHKRPTGSMHLMLPEPFHALALAKGWALRHPFAERSWGPEATVFVFGPRNDEELLWAKGLLAVSHAWASGVLLAQGGEQASVENYR